MKTIRSAFERYGRLYENRPFVFFVGTYVGVVGAFLLMDLITGDEISAGTFWFPALAIVVNLIVRYISRAAKRDQPTREAFSKNPDDYR